MQTHDPAFNFEVIKLMLQAAWADLQITSQEAQLLLGWAKRLGLYPQDQQTVIACLQGKQKLPPPDLGLLRLHREEVLGMVQALCESDAELPQDEQEILEEIRLLLGG